MCRKVCCDSLWKDTDEFWAKNMIQLWQVFSPWLRSLWIKPSTRKQRTCYDKQSQERSDYWASTMYVFTFGVYHKLAILLRQVRKYDEALLLHRKALSGYLQHFGVDHQHTADCRNDYELLKADMGLASGDHSEVAFMARQPGHISTASDTGIAEDIAANEARMVDPGVFVNQRKAARITSTSSQSVLLALQALSGKEISRSRQLWWKRALASVQKKG